MQNHSGCSVESSILLSVDSERKIRELRGGMGLPSESRMCRTAQGGLLSLPSSRRRSGPPAQAIPPDRSHCSLVCTLAALLIFCHGNHTNREKQPSIGDTNDDNHAELEKNYFGWIKALIETN